METADPRLDIFGRLLDAKAEIGIGILLRHLLYGLSLTDRHSIKQKSCDSHVPSGANISSCYQSPAQGSIPISLMSKHGAGSAWCTRYTANFTLIGVIIRWLYRFVIRKKLANYSWSQTALVFAVISFARATGVWRVPYVEDGSLYLLSHKAAFCLPFEGARMGWFLKNHCEIQCVEWKHPKWTTATKYGPTLPLIKCLWYLIVAAFWTSIQIKIYSILSHFLDSSQSEYCSLFLCRYLLRHFCHDY